jgi:hypothetical protein
MKLLLQCIMYLINVILRHNVCPSPIIISDNLNDSYDQLCRLYIDSKILSVDTKN